MKRSPLKRSPMRRNTAKALEWQRRPRKPLKGRSEATQRLYEDIYEPMKREKVGGPCEIKSPVCTGTAQALHEILPRGRAGGLAAALRDGPPPVGACHACNRYVSQEGQAWAVEHGFLMSRKGMVDG